MEKSRSNSGEEQTGFKKVHKERKPQKPDNQFLQKRMESIAHKIVVLSGKGGVGKSTVAVNLAVALSLAGRKIGLLDVDMHGPSVPGMLHLETNRLNMEHNVIIPVDFHGVKVMSIGFLLPHKDDAVIWRGPLKMGVIRQFLGDVDWGDLDCLIIDSPPGTGDEPLSVCQLMGNVDGAIVVTTPQDVATNDGRKCINFCKQLKLPVLGVVENMSGFVCPHCEKKTDIFKTDGGRQMAEEMGVPFLGAIPLDPLIGESCDKESRIFKCLPKAPEPGLLGILSNPLLTSFSRKTRRRVMRFPIPAQVMRKFFVLPFPGREKAWRLILGIVRISWLWMLILHRLKSWKSGRSSLRYISRGCFPVGW